MIDSLTHPTFFCWKNSIFFPLDDNLIFFSVPLCSCCQKNEWKPSFWLLRTLTIKAVVRTVFWCLFFFSHGTNLIERKNDFIWNFPVTHKQQYPMTIHLFWGKYLQIFWCQPFCVKPIVAWQSRYGKNWENGTYHVTLAFFIYIGLLLSPLEILHYIIDTTRKQFFSYLVRTLWKFRFYGDPRKSKIDTP